MKSINDTEALKEINSGRYVGFYIHTGTPYEMSLLRQIESFGTITTMTLYELHNDNITNPKETLMAFTRFPRLIVYFHRAIEHDCIGIPAIETWLDNLLK